MNQVKFKKCKKIFKSKYFAFLIQFTRFKDFVSGFRRSQHWTLNQHLTIYKSGKVIALKVLWIKINHVIMRPIQNFSFSCLINSKMLCGKTDVKIDADCKYSRSFTHLSQHTTPAITKTVFRLFHHQIFWQRALMQTTKKLLQPTRCMLIIRVSLS